MPCMKYFKECSEGKPRGECQKRAGFSTWTGAVNEFTRKVLVLDVYDKVGFDNEEFIKEAFIIVNPIKLCKLPPQKDSSRGKGWQHMLEMSPEKVDTLQKE